MGHFGKVHLWLFFQAILHLSWGHLASQCIRINWWGKSAWLTEKGEVITVLGISPGIYVASVRLCTELLCRRHRETEASLHLQYADGESIMWQTAKACKRNKNFESNTLGRKLASWSFLFFLNQFRAHRRCWTVRQNSFLNTQSRYSKWWCWSFLNGMGAFQPRLRGTTSRWRGEFIIQLSMFFFLCVCCQQRHQLVHSLSIEANESRNNGIKGDMCLLLELCFDIYFVFHQGLQSFALI